MPSISFILPHWLYWLGLIVFPLLALYAVRRERRFGKAEQNISIAIGYMIWLTAGFAGMHRFYVRSNWGWVFIPLFLGVLFANVEVKEAREGMSRARLELRVANSDLDRAKREVAQSAAGAQDRLARAQPRQEAAAAHMAHENDRHDMWKNISGGFGAVLALLLVIDAFLLPRLIRQCRAREAANPQSRFVAVAPPPDVATIGTGQDPTVTVQTRASRALEWVTENSGVFVAWWTVLSIFVYYYEVIVRFVFNSPTNWVHESMFLMFGIQYLIAGAYAMRADAHVRVDVFYVKFSARGRAIADLLTSVFFFIFVGTMLVTGYIYMMDSIRLDERSFSEWGVHYWPVKIAIPLGAALLLLQGLARVIKDVKLVANPAR
jgi:TRAP-type mannitol/chloroaromatic compound transport system permease small subunit